MIRLFAVRGTESRYLGSFASLEDAARHIEELEARGSFPESFEAVALDTDGRRWHYTDEWLLDEQ